MSEVPPARRINYRHQVWRRLIPIDDEEDKTKGKARSGETALDDDAETLVWESGECPPEARARFRQSVAAYEQAPSTTHFQLLEEAGIKLPSPESKNDRQLEAKPWEVIEGLAGLRVFLSQTGRGRIFGWQLGWRLTLRTMQTMRNSDT